MNRSQRHQALRENKEHFRIANDFTKRQMEVVEILATKKAVEMISKISEDIDGCYMKALRLNRVSEERAIKIISKIAELIKMEGR